MTPTRMSDPAAVLPAAPPDSPGPSPARILHVLVGVALALVGPGCGPIEADQPEARAPYIDPDSTIPNQRVIRVSSPNRVTFSAKPYDPNDPSPATGPENELHTMWLLEESSSLKSDTLSASQTTPTQLNGEPFYPYETAEIGIQPCRADIIADENPQTETIWLYVGDRQLTFTPQGSNDRDVSVAPGGYMVSHSWVLVLEGNPCQ